MTVRARPLMGMIKELPGWADVASFLPQDKDERALAEIAIALLVLQMRAIAQTEALDKAVGDEK